MLNVNTNPFLTEGVSSISEEENMDNYFTKTQVNEIVQDLIQMIKDNKVELPESKDYDNHIAKLEESIETKLSTKGGQIEGDTTIKGTASLLFDHGRIRSGGLTDDQLVITSGGGIQLDNAYLSRDGKFETAQFSEGGELLANKYASKNTVEEHSQQLGDIKFVTMTKSQYNQTTKDPNTVYFVL